MVMVIVSLYLHFQLAHLSQYVFELEENGQEQTAQIRALQMFIKDKDMQVQSLADQLSQVETERTAVLQQLNAKGILAAEQSDIIERLRSDARTNHVNLEKTTKEESSLRHSLGDANSVLQELESQFRTCNDDREDLLADLNTTKQQAQEAEERASHAIVCCDSVPMCNLCRLRKSSR